mmetsp:Transcript_26755/g.40592  ORF Transcript_26755/g.40592 Transcript_26755/m.40592 type:complete len:95 (-) Transcript_26755:91-375(-)
MPSLNTFQEEGTNAGSKRGDTMKDPKCKEEPFKERACRVFLVTAVRRHDQHGLPDEEKACAASVGTRGYFREARMHRPIHGATKHHLAEAKTTT